MAKEEVDNLKLYEMLQSDVKVKCPKCNKGIIRPFNPRNLTNFHNIHSFFCDFCDYYIRYDPVIDIE